MGNDIDSAIGGSILRPENANRGRRVKPVTYTFFIHIVNILKTQDTNGISLAGKGTRRRQ